MEPPADIRALTQAIKAKARSLGFDSVGIAAAGPADPDGRLAAWLHRGFDADMTYMAQSAVERANPERLIPGARSVIACAISYFSPEPEPDGPKISRYARSADYHNIVRKKVRKLRQALLRLVPDAKAQPTVDTSPVLERAWAQRAGIAWIGKSTMAIAPRLGTYTFLATVITDVELEPDAPHPDRCGTCTACLAACPPDAVAGPYELDARRCITYWNVEQREELPSDAPAFHGWIAGCDVCQEVCPWNKFAHPTTERRFAPRPELREVDVVRLARDPAYATELIAGTALQRTGGEAMQRNAQRVIEESQ